MRRLKITLLVMVMTAGIFIVFGPTVLPAMGRWLVVASTPAKADLIVALGGDRVRQDIAVKLLQQGIAQKILFVGPDVRHADYACVGILPRQVIAQAEAAFTTHEEALRVREVARQHGLQSLLVVTSDYHSRRTDWVFRKVLADTDIKLYVTAVSRPAIRPENWWQSYIGRKLILSEFIALIFYYLTV